MCIKLVYGKLESSSPDEVARFVLLLSSPNAIDDSTNFVAFDPVQLDSEFSDFVEMTRVIAAQSKPNICIELLPDGFVECSHEWVELLFSQHLVDFVDVDVRNV